MLADPPPSHTSPDALSPPPPADPDLDRVAAMASRLLGAPASLVTVVEGGDQHFRGQHGLPEPLASERRTPLAQSLCREVVRTGEPLVLEDAAADPRYGAHGAVTELGVGAYLGIPLRGNGLHAGGTLCALAWEPRAWSDEDARTLQDLAALAERLLGGAPPPAPGREDRLRTIFDASFQFMGLMRPDGTVLEMNQPALDFGGVTAAEVVGRPLWEAPWFRHSARVRSELRAAVRRAADGAFVRYDVEAAGADGALVPLDLSLKPVFEGARVAALIPEGRALSEEVRALHMQEALQAGRVGTWTIDFDTDAVTRSKSTDAVFGFPQDGAPRAVEDYLGRMHPDDAFAARAAVLRAVDEGAPFTARLRVVLPGGEVRRVVARGEGVRGPSGRPSRITGALTDVTEQEAAEAALRRSEELRSLALEAVGMGAWAIDLATGEAEIDARERALLGLAEGATLADFYARVHPDDHAALREALRRAAEEGEEYEHEFRLLHPGGGVRWIAGKGRRLAEEPDGKGWLVGINFDVTEQLQAREDIRESEARFRRIAEAVPLVVFITGPGGEVEYLNDQWYAFSGQERGGHLPMALWEAVHPEDRPVLEGVWEEARAWGHPLDMESRLRAGDGSYRWFLLRSVPLRGAEGGVERWFGAATDIHFQKTIEATLERRVAERTDELNRSNQELDQFAYVASHDLKAPLRGIANLATWIEEDVGGGLPPDSRRHLTLLHGRIERMERLLDDLLAYSRIGRVEAEPEALDPAAVVRELAELLAPPAGFEVHVSGEMPRIVTPRAPFEAVLRNLIHNAVKHHHRAAGRVVVSAADAGGGFLAFTVSDDGPGIAREYHERVFRLFQTLRPRDEVEGSGMGLAYVKKTVETMGGAVRLVSEPGHGAAFRFTWPATPPPASPPPWPHP